MLSLLTTCQEIDDRNTTRKGERSDDLLYSHVVSLFQLPLERSTEQVELATEDGRITAEAPRVALAQRLATSVEHERGDLTLSTTAIATEEVADDVAVVVVRLADLRHGTPTGSFEESNRRRCFQRVHDPELHVRVVVVGVDQYVPVLRCRGAGTPQSQCERTRRERAFLHERASIIRFDVGPVFRCLF
jgi:hypothetical protein